MTDYNTVKHELTAAMLNRFAAKMSVHNVEVATGENTVTRALFETVAESVVEVLRGMIEGLGGSTAPANSDQQT